MGNVVRSLRYCWIYYPSINVVVKQVDHLMPSFNQLSIPFIHRVSCLMALDIVLIEIFKSKSSSTRYGNVRVSRHAATAAVFRKLHDL